MFNKSGKTQKDKHLNAESRKFEHTGATDRVIVSMALQVGVLGGGIY